jgi:hypothetical protein
MERRLLVDLDLRLSLSLLPSGLSMSRVSLV